MDASLSGVHINIECFVVVSDLDLALDVSSHWGGFLSVSPVSEMTYTVSSGTLNYHIPYHTIPYYSQLSFLFF